MKKVKWGIVGTGWISTMYTENMKAVEEAERYAVCGHTMEKAKLFAQLHGFKKVYDSLDALLVDPEVDCIFIGTRNNLHAPMLRSCIQAGKPVVCTKPLTCTQEETEEICRLSQEKKVPVFEEMWPVYRPDMLAAREAIRSGEIGEVVRLEARCCYHSPGGYDLNSRLCHKEEGGGGTLSMGVYNVSMVQFLLDMEPSEVLAQGNVGPTGTDLAMQMILRYHNLAPNHTLAYMTTTNFGDNRQDIYVAGTKGILNIERFWYSNSYIITDYDGNVREFVFDESPSDQIEKHDHFIRSVNRYLLDGDETRIVFPIEETAKAARLMQQALAQIGVDYSDILVRETQ